MHACRSPKERRKRQNVSFELVFEHTEPEKNLNPKKDRTRIPSYKRAMNRLSFQLKNLLKKLNVLGMEQKSNIPNFVFLRFPNFVDKIECL
jgi:hypothetical protein